MDHRVMHHHQVTDHQYASPVHRSRATRVVLGLTFATLSAAMIVQNRSRNAERGHPPMGQFVDVDGVRLHYVERGQGQPVVLLHGNTMMGLDFLLSDVCGTLPAARRPRLRDRHFIWGFPRSARSPLLWGLGPVFPPAAHCQREASLQRSDRTAYLLVHACQLLWHA